MKFAVMTCVFLDGWISRTVLCGKVTTNNVCPTSILFTEAVKYTLRTDTAHVSIQGINASQSAVTLDFCLINPPQRGCHVLIQTC